MKKLLVKVFARWDKNFGDSALEFAAAIAVGSLRLAKRDMETLLDDALKQHAGMQSELLGMLVLAKQANQWSGPMGLVNGPLSLLNHRCPSKIEASVGSWPKRNPGSPTPWHLTCSSKLDQITSNNRRYQLPAASIVAKWRIVTPNFEQWIGAG